MKEAFSSGKFINADSLEVTGVRHVVAATRIEAFKEVLNMDHEELTKEFDDGND